jgi:DNA-binding MarR family transcriptional regulator
VTRNPLSANGDPRSGDWATTPDSGAEHPDASDGSLLRLGKLLARELRLRTELSARLDDARWMILLEIYLAMRELRDIPFMSAAHASGVPISTAQRYIHEMTDAGLIFQHQSEDDQRIRHVSLTQSGLDLVALILDRTMALRTRAD